MSIDMSIDLEEQYDRIYRYCYFRLRSRQAAEDITQETFLRYLDKYRYDHCAAGEQALHYLYTIARNLCTDEYRRRSRERLWEPSNETVSADASHEALVRENSCTMSFGQACLAGYGILILTAVFVGVLVLVLSEILHNNIATLSVCVGMIIAGMVCKVPYQHRAFAQFWDWLPMRFLNAENIFDVRTISVFGHCFVSWKIVPVIYILIGVLAAVAGKVVHRNYQVSGR